jgi:hypothetical protein
MSLKLKILLLLLLVVGLGLAAYLVLGGKTSLYKSEHHLLKAKTARFFECIKFKEFGEAAAFHDAEDQKKANIPKLIEDLFSVPPEQLDIQEITVLFAEIDSTGILAKTKTRCVVHLLNSKEVRKPEVILYWRKQSGKWYLKLESSLKKRPHM